jgi:uncharacterized protein YneF (UPF0154 family)
MNVFKILLYAFLIYIAYRFVFGFIIPVYRTMKQVKKQFREMNDRMNEYVQQQEKQFNQTQEQQPQQPQERKGDYVEFEEIKKN